MGGRDLWTCGCEAVVERELWRGTCEPVGGRDCGPVGGRDCGLWMWSCGREREGPVDLWGRGPWRGFVPSQGRTCEWVQVTDVRSFLGGELKEHIGYL